MMGEWEDSWNYIRQTGKRYNIKQKIEQNNLEEPGLGIELKKMKKVLTRQHGALTGLLILGPETSEMLNVHRREH